MALTARIWGWLLFVFCGGQPGRRRRAGDQLLVRRASTSPARAGAEHLKGALHAIVNYDSAGGAGDMIEFLLAVKEDGGRCS